MTNDQKVLKVDVVARDVADHAEEIARQRERIVALELHVAQLTERMTLFQLAQGVFTVIASTVAAAFGGRG